MEDSVLTSPYENQGGMRPSSQRFSNLEMQIHQENYQPVPFSLLAASQHLPCFFLKINFFPKLTALMSQTQPEPTFKTQRAADLALQHVVFVF